LVQTAIARPADERVNWKTSWPFFLLHALPLLAFFTGVTMKAVVLCAVLYVVRMFFITAGYHRYFAHRSYKTSRAFQFILAAGGATAAQKGPLWWAGHHRDHHRFSDTERDVHSPLKGFWWSHVGWILSDKFNDFDYEHKIKDFWKYPELRFVERYNGFFPWILAIGCYLFAGWSGLLIGFFLSTVLLWHGTFTVNSLAHVLGRRRYATTDTSRNSFLIALWTLGEGWHNNHHYYAASARQGFFWWEYDISYYVLRLLSIFHVVRDLKTPPARVKAAARVRDGQLDIGMFSAHWRKATAAVSAATAALSSAGAALHERVSGGITEAPHALAETAAPDGADEKARQRAELEAKFLASRAALEGEFRTALEKAEELAKLTRLGRRELELVD
jgi:stearoyl-CoA desaturase (delta-9 desaturase)